MKLFEIRKEYLFTLILFFTGLVPQKICTQNILTVNGERLNRHLEQLAEFGKNPEGGVSRLAYSQADLSAREYLISLMEEAGLTVAIDAAGNIIGRRAGADSGLPAIMIGSHSDSVPEGGNYDGQAGVISSIEVAQVLSDSNFKMNHPLIVIIFANEEGGKTGSRALFGNVTELDLELKTQSGFTNREGMRRIGGNPDMLENAALEQGDIAVFIELHVEQGGILESREKSIGVVEGIVGIKRWVVTIDGFANHAGTTPMDARQDALLGAAKLINAVNEVVRTQPGNQVGTVGSIEAQPGAPNVIAGRVVTSLEIRDLEMEKIDALYEKINLKANKIASELNLNIGFKHVYTTQSAVADTYIQNVIEEASGELGLTCMYLPSGAGHDAQSIAHLAPIGMIFIPSIGGISHSPKEYSEKIDITNGANVLLQSVIKLDKMKLVQ